MRQFDTGATRDDDEAKIDPEGFLSPLVIARYSEYMSKHRKQADGNLRNSDNWQKGIPLSAYIKSAWRHFLDVWLMHRGLKPRHNDYCAEGEMCDTMEEALCAILFNVMGYLFEYMRQPKPAKERAPFADRESQQAECHAHGGNYCWNSNSCYSSLESHKQRHPWHWESMHPQAVNAPK